MKHSCYSLLNSPGGEAVLTHVHHPMHSSPPAEPLGEGMYVHIADTEQPV